MSNNSSTPYKFTILNGVVTQVLEYKKGSFKVDNIDSNEAYFYDGTNVIKTEQDHGRIKTTVFTDVDADGIFYGSVQTSAQKTGVNSVPSISSSNQNGYQFKVVDGVITTVSEIKQGIVKQERIDSNEKWIVDGLNFVKTEFEHGVTETTVYSDTDGNGIFTKASKTYTTTDGSLWTGLTGGDSDDRWTGRNSDDAYHSGLGNDQLTGGQGNDDLYGGDGNDRLYGDSGADDLYGGDGDDNLFGGIDNDHLEGDIGNDTLIAGDGDDYLSGGEGGDNLEGGNGNDDLYGGLGVDRLNGGEGSDNLYGGLDNDLLNGNNGIDHLEGNEGDDSLDGGASDDYLNGGVGSDYLLGGAGNDDLYGDIGLDRLNGGIGNDNIYGGDGNDLLIGGIGSDNLYGSVGNDSFIYSSIFESGLTNTSRDHIYDFEIGDKIDLSSIDAKSGAKGNNSFTFFDSYSAVNTTNADGALWIVDDVIYGSTDRDIAAEFSIQVIGVVNLSASDFVL